MAHSRPLVSSSRPLHTLSPFTSSIQLLFSCLHIPASSSRFPSTSPVSYFLSPFTSSRKTVSCSSLVFTFSLFLYLHTTVSFSCPSSPLVPCLPLSILIFHPFTNSSACIPSYSIYLSPVPRSLHGHYFLSLSVSVRLSLPLSIVLFFCFLCTALHFQILLFLILFFLYSVPHPRLYIHVHLSFCTLPLSLVSSLSLFFSLCS